MRQAVLCTSYVPPCAPMVCQQCVFAPPLCISSAVRPRRGWRAVDRVARLSLDEEALRIVTHAEQIGAFRIGGSVDLQRAVGIGAGFVP